MRTKLPLGVVPLLCILCFILPVGAWALEIRLGEPLEIGREELLFGAVTAVCEDGSGNFYVVDQLEHRVLVFSRDGKRLGSFGRKGQGPGDFQRPDRISLTPEGHLAVADEMDLISFLEKDGSFLRRVKLENALAPGYIGPNRFYGWRWTPEGQQQILLDGQSRILKTFHSVPMDRFSVSAPDRSGRAVMFNYGRPAFSPGLLYAHNGGLTALAVTDVYRIQLLDGAGDVRAQIERKVEPAELSRGERRFLEKEFKEFGKMRGWPESVVRDIIRHLPENKVYFDRILLSETHVFVCRIRNDISGKGERFPVDVFATSGEFLGTGALPEEPIFVSAARMYFASSDQDGNVWLTVREYDLE
jgi:hypothetical protein